MNTVDKILVKLPILMLSLLRQINMFLRVCFFYTHVLYIVFTPLWILHQDLQHPFPRCNAVDKIPFPRSCLLLRAYSELISLPRRGSLHVKQCRFLSRPRSARQPRRLLSSAADRRASSGGGVGAEGVATGQRYRARIPPTRARL